MMNYYSWLILMSSYHSSSSQTPQWDQNRDSHPLIQSTNRKDLQSIKTLFENCNSTRDKLELLNILTYVPLRLLPFTPLANPHQNRETALHLSLKYSFHDISEYLLSLYSQTKAPIGLMNKVSASLQSSANHLLSFQDNETVLHLAIKTRNFNHTKVILGLMSQQEINITDSV
jgi:hypothetical protein